MFPKSYGSCAIVQFLNAFFSFSGFQNTVLLKSQNQTVRLFAFQLKKKRVCLVKLLGQMTLITHTKSTRIYMVWQFAYIHRWRQREFHYKIGRLQQWHKDSLKKPRPKIHSSLTFTKGTKQGIPLVFDSNICNC